MTSSHRERREGFGAWFGLACLLHVAVWGALSRHSQSQRAGDVGRSPAVLDEIEIAELPELPRELEAPSAEASLPSSRAASQQSSRSAPRVARAPVAAALGADAADATSVPAEPNVGAELATADAAEAATPLAPDALGIGANNPFVARGSPGAGGPRREAPRESARAVGASRFKRSLATEIVRAEQSHALGPEGPVLTLLENAVRTGDEALNSTARFRFVTDADGRLVSAELVSSSSDPEPWRRHAKSLLDGLKTTKLRVPKTGHGVTFIVRVESRVQLPSGADPGAEISVLGIPLQHGQGPRSTRIEILNLTPKLTTKEEQLPSGQTVSVPQLGIGNIFSLMGDLSDIGAKAQRMVHAHLEKLSANEITK